MTVAMEALKDLLNKLIGKVKMKIIRPKLNFKRILKPYLITSNIFKRVEIDLTQVEEVRSNKVNIMGIVKITWIDKLLRNNNKGAASITLLTNQLRAIQF